MFLALIPARYASSRFPGKPLARIGGREMILRVCDRVAEAGIPLAVATDDRRIADCVEGAGYRAIMTRADHQSGTDRLAEAYRLSGSDARVVINVQGDEPFIALSQLEQIRQAFEDPEVDIATLARPYPADAPVEGLEDPNLVKVVCGDDMRALYFSRSVIPHLRGVEKNEWAARFPYLTHIGIYAYRAEVLQQITALPRSPLEIAESLEQLRWLQAGLRIQVGVSQEQTVGIDTPADLEAAERLFAARKDVQDHTEA